MRQVGVGSHGVAEALAIFHQRSFDERASGSLNAPPARITVDERNSFGMIEWSAVEYPAGSLFSKHAAVAGCEHVASETRLHVAEHQAAGIVPWVGAHTDEDIHRLPGGHWCRMHQLQNFQLAGPEKLTGADDPRHALQEHGGSADFWYLACDILCHPVLVLLYLQAFDTANAKMGAETNKRQQSSTTSKIWTTPLLTVRSVKFAPHPPLRQRYTTALHRRPTLGQSGRVSGPCTNVFSSARTAERLCVSL